MFACFASFFMRRSHEANDAKINKWFSVSAQAYQEKHSKNLKDKTKNKERGEPEKMYYIMKEIREAIQK